MTLATPPSIRDWFKMQTVDVLFLCETNSATSLMAEALLNQRGDIRVRAFSAGNRPAAALLPEAGRRSANGQSPPTASSPSPGRSSPCRAA